MAGMKEANTASGKLPPGMLIGRTDDEGIVYVDHQEQARYFYDVRFAPTPWVWIARAPSGHAIGHCTNRTEAEVAAIKAASAD